MATKLTLFLLLAVFSNVACSKQDYSNEIKYGMAYCLSKSYVDTEVASDARHIAGSYLQKGSYGLHMYESIRDFVDKAREKKYLSKHNRNLSIMQCLDLSSSSDFLSAIEKSANRVAGGL